MACGSGACSDPLDLACSSEPAPAHPVRRVRAWQWLLKLVAAHERWRQRQALMELDDRLLADIGITRSELMAEVTKPFWR